jgi:hypothetical protein
MGNKSSIENRREDASGHNVRIIYVWIGLRTLSAWLLGANHWSVILKLSNGQYACIQKNTNDDISCEVGSSLETSAKRTWGGEGYKVRLSCYGSCDKSWTEFRNNLWVRDSYIYILWDCQNFARKIVDDLTGKTAGLWPIENGPKFTY